jgi:hypothetical protein
MNATEKQIIEHLIRAAKHASVSMSTAESGDLQQAANAAQCLLDGNAEQPLEVFTGYIKINRSGRIEFDFEVPAGSTQETKDHHALNAVAEVIEVNYLSVGIKG